MFSAALLLPVVLFAPDQVKLSAKPGGKVTLSYGSPTWRDDFATQIKVNSPWRLGNNDATTMETEAGLVFADAVVFPGTYNVGAMPTSSDAWQLLFHHAGQFPDQKTQEAAPAMKEKEVPKKEFAKKLLIEIVPDKAGGYVFRATFGPRRFEGTFKTAKGKAVKGKAGSVALTSTYLEREDVDQLAESIEKELTPLARLEPKGMDHALRLYVKGGQTPTLVAVAPGETPSSPSFQVDGAATESAAPKKVVAHSIENGDAGAKLVFEVGKKVYTFTIEASKLSK